MKIVYKTIRFVIDVLPSKYRVKLVIVGCLLFLSSFLDLLGLGALLPVFSVLLEENGIETNPLLKGIYNTLNLTSENQLVVILAVGLFLVILTKNILGILIVKHNSTFALGLSKDFALKMHQIYYKKGFSFFKSTNSNVVMRNVNGATGQFAQQQVLGSLNFLNEIIVLVSIVIFIAIYNFKILLLLGLTVLPPFMFFYNWVRKKSFELGNVTKQVTPLVGKNMFQSIFGFVDVKIVGAEREFREKIENNLDNLLDVKIKSNIYNMAPTRVIETSIMLAVAIMISFGIYFFPSKIELLKILGLFAVAGYRIMPSINRMMVAINGLNQCSWIFEVLAPLKEETNLLKDEKQVGLEFNEYLKLENLDFAYPDSDEPVLKDINLTIKKGEVVGLVGPSGAGKTTLMNVLLGFLNPTKGKYFIDQTELDACHEKAFFEKVGYVQQQVYLIDGSIAENIAFGCKKEEIDYNKLQLVLERANLKEMVDGLENGIEEIIGENGTRLSGGQRQRMGIARALYFDSEILFLDEATSALDSKTEKDITDSINSLSDGKLTIIIIAHRLSTLEHCNRIIKVDNKKLIEETVNL